MAAPPSALSLPEAARPTRVRYAVLAVLCSLAFLTYLDRICIMRVQGEIARDLHFGQLTETDEQALRARGEQDDVRARERLGEQQVNERLGWVFSAFVVGYVLFEIPGGWLGDVWSSRLVLAGIVLWWSLWTALTGSVDTIAGWLAANPAPWMLVGGLVTARFLFGLGEAGAYPNIGRLLGRWFPFKDRAAAQGAIWMSSRLGGAVAPMVIGTLMLAAGGWRGAFWLLGLAGALWSVFFFLWFRDRPEETPGVNAAEGALIRGGQGGRGSIYDDHHRGVPWKRLLFSRNLWAVYLVAFAINFSWYFYITFLPKYLKDRFGVDFADSEIMTGLPLLVGGLSCLAGGRLSDRLIRRSGSLRWGRSLVGVAGYTAAGLCTLVVPSVGTAWGVIAMICVACAFQDLAVPVLWSVCTDIGQSYAGTVGGCMNAVGAVGGALSPLFAARLGWEMIFFAYGAAYLLGGLLWLGIDASRSVTSTDRPAAS